MSMQVSTLQDNFVKGLKAISKAVAKKSRLAVLENVKISTDCGRLMLQTTSLDLGATVWVGAMVDMDGAITVNYEKLKKLTSLLSPERIDFEVIERTQQLKMSCGASRTTFDGISALEFPVLPTPTEEDTTICVNWADFRAAFNAVKYAAAKDSARTSLMCLDMRVENGELYLLASDSYRLAQSSVPVLEDKYPDSLDHAHLKQPVTTAVAFERCFILIDLVADAIAIVKGYSGDEMEFLHIVRQGKNVFFHGKNVEVVVQEIDLPTTAIDWTNTLKDAEQYTNKTIVDAVGLETALKRAQAAIEKSESVQIVVDDQDSIAGIITVKGWSRGIKQDTILDATVEGDNFSMTYKPGQLLEILNTMKQDDYWDRAVLSYNPQDTGKPLCIKQLNCKAVHLVNPTSTRQYRE